jgi:molybdate transport system ATP-binding protein
MEERLDVRFLKKLGSFRLNVALTLGTEIGVIFGPSGAGKSQTLRVLVGLSKPDEGYIKLNGRVLADASKKISVPPKDRRIGLVFQELSLFPHLTALENVAYGLKCGDRLEVAAEWLHMVRLDGLSDRYPHQLSGGQRQRVALARALAPGPDLLLLDEPFNALDGPVRRALRRELKGLFNETKTPIIYVTHDIEDVCSMADRVFFIRDGELAASIPVQSLWDPSVQGSIWHSLGWGTLVHGTVEERSGLCWIVWDGGRLVLPPTVRVKGDVTAFVAPHHVKLLYHDLPVDLELEDNVMEGVVAERVVLGGTTRLFVRACNLQWQVEFLNGSYVTMELSEGQRVRMAVKPGCIYILGSAPNSCTLDPCTETQFEQERSAPFPALDEKGEMAYEGEDLDHRGSLGASPLARSHPDRR